MTQRILVPMDGSKMAERALRVAARLARTEQAELLLLHVIGDFPTLRELVSALAIDELQAQRCAEAEAMLERAAARVDHVGSVVVRAATTNVAECIVREARLARCGLIVMGTHGRSGLSRLLLGSTAEAVARSSKVPVLLVPQGARAAAPRRPASRPTADAEARS
jgi:nucleotide-binding universal stress UspA family protein